MGGACYFGEFSDFSPSQTAFFILGLVLTLIGVGLLILRRQGRTVQRPIIENKPFGSELENGVPLSYVEDPRRGWYGMYYEGTIWEENPHSTNTVLPITFFNRYIISDTTKQPETYHQQPNLVTIFQKVTEVKA